MSSLVAGVEIGGTKCICTLATPAGEICDQVVVETGQPEPTLQALFEILKTWRQTHQICGLGIASFGPLDLEPSSAGFATFVRTPKPDWSGTSLLALVGPEPFAIDTDVSGAALAEGHWGAAQSLTSWTYITVGTGVGVGSVVDGRPVKGLGHSEAGHLRVPRHGDEWPGICPYHKDCVEGLASGPALEARTGRKGREISVDDAALDHAAQALAYLCHNLIYTVVPERILMGGGVMLGQKTLLDSVRTKLAASLSGYGEGQGIVDRLDEFLTLPGLGQQAGPLGSVCLALEACDRSANSSC